MTDGEFRDHGHAPVREGHHEGEYREFRLTNFALNQRISVLMLLLLTAIMGVSAYVSIPKESSPEITIPIIAVSVIYPGVAPRDMETLVARPIEEELNTIADIKELTSTSVEGYSNIVAEFENGYDMDEALNKVREKVDLAKPKLPADAEEPSVMEFNLSEFPIMNVNISGPYGLERLKDVAEDVQDALEGIPAVLQVNLSGGLDREVKVEVDLAALKYYGVTFTDVVDAIREENVNIPGGVVDVGNQEYTLRVAGEFVETAPLEDVVVVVRNGRPIYVRDLGTIDFAYKERETYARLDGTPVITLGIVKRSGENIIETAEAVKATIARMEAAFPEGTVAKITGDQSEDIHGMVSSLENNIISGLLLVLAVLMFFLGVRNAAFVAISIPTSMLLSFIVMNGLGISMNMVVLFSLILALGMLVDNAIVVVENIYRYIEEGHDNWTAARRATGEIAVPVVASTLTTLAAFGPLLFWPGIAGEFMSYLPLTLIITLSSSLFVALVIVPVLCAMFMKLDGEKSPPLTPAGRWTLIGIAGAVALVVAAANPLTALLLVATGAAVYLLHHHVMVKIARWFQEAFLPRGIRAYEKRLRWALNHRLVVLAGAGATFVLTALLFGLFNSGVEYFPESIPPAMVMAQIDVPSGTRPEFLNGLAERVEGQLRELEGFEDVESVVTTVGSSGQGVGAMFSGGGDANVTLQFVDFEDRKHDAFVTLARMQETVGTGIAGAEITMANQQGGPPTGAPVSIEIVGEDPATLKRLADRAVGLLQAAPVGARLEGLESDMDDARQELVITVDRERAALYGLSTFEVGNTIRGAIQGTEAAKFRQGEEEFDIVVRLAERWRQDLDALDDLTVLAEGVQVPLLSVADWRIQEGAGSVKRKDLDRVVTVTSDVVAGANSNAVLGEVQRTLAESGFVRDLPPGYALRYTGEQEEQQEAMRFLGRAFLVALFLIAFILISQFNSVIKPVIIISSVVMSTVGVLIGLMIFRMPFGVIMTGVGIISLAGVVVNNAIVLIDYIDILRERDGLNRREALVQGGKTRFRPVVLTAITTVLGLVPLAIGLNFDFFGLFTSLSPNLYWGGEQAAWWGPMAIAVIAGLSFATVLTLVLVPVMYSLVDDVGEFFRRHYTRGPGAPVEAGGDDGRHAAAREDARERVAVGV
ncbi:MAG TPA: efflux RND transporter permease subunit [Longimicrobiales bacterium]|nr:efflux RND transporter permease subunit [Longimicrobiales bacterium]